MRSVGTDKAVADLLKPYSPEVQKLALSTRAFVVRLLPKATEMVDTKSNVIGFGFGAGYNDIICSVMPAKNWLTLGIRLGRRTGY